MGRTSKLPRYKEFNDFKNGFGARQANTGTWSDYLSEKDKLNVELGCGKAELSIELAKQNPNQNFVGVDKKADRLWRAAKNSLDDKISNIAFIQTDILNLEEYFKPNSIDMIWITFPDPFPRDKQAKHRMINNPFLDIYKRLLKEDGHMRLKTDDQNLFNYLRDEVLTSRKDIEIKRNTENLHESDFEDELKILTTFEQKWLKEDKTIHFIEWCFT